IDPQGQTLPLVLLASTEDRRIWALGLSDATGGEASSAVPSAWSIYPVMGGGAMGLEHGAPENLLDASLPAVDRLCTIHDAAVLFGPHRQPGWHALFLPVMVPRLHLDEYYRPHRSPLRGSGPPDRGDS